MLLHAWLAVLISTSTHLRAIVEKVVASEYVDQPMTATAHKMTSRSGSITLLLVRQRGGWVVIDADLGNISSGRFVQSSDTKDVTSINQQIRYTFMDVLYNGS